jgi:superfamily I DNA/RNA helicase
VRYLTKPPLHVVDGPPGTGKSTDIIRRATEGDWKGKRVAVLTYTNAAADVIRQRAPWITAGTVYSLLWSSVKEVLPPSYTKGMRRRTKRKAAYHDRRVENWRDNALERYTKDAPSKRPPTPLNIVAQQLHSWDATTPCEIDLEALEPVQELTFILPMAYWLSKGAPLSQASGQFDVVVIDEAQDMSALEIASALRLVAPGGEAHAYGDPGQAIFSNSKGLEAGKLPYVWEHADTKTELTTGYRCGSAVAKAASGILRSYYDRSHENFTAEHATPISLWQVPEINPQIYKGLVMGWSRNHVNNLFTRWNLRGVAIVPGLADASKELVVCTGHSAKGAEADEVYLLPWTATAMEGLYSLDPERLKLLYVMTTRARRRLHLPPELYAFVNSMKIS